MFPPTRRHLVLELIALVKGAALWATLIHREPRARFLRRLLPVALLVNLPYFTQQ